MHSLSRRNDALGKADIIHSNFTRRI